MDRLRGFTLIELLVVLLVLGSALAMAVPALPADRSGEPAPAEALRFLMERTRRAAADSGAEASLTILTHSDEYIVRLHRDLLTGDSIILAGSLGLGAVELQGVAEPGSLEVVTIRWSATGRSSGGTLRLKDGNGNTTLIDIEPWRGATRVESQ
jgi:prepilin-type N-terminal cleavage/methylation domain-containing protein